MKGRMKYYDIWTDPVNPQLNLLTKKKLIMQGESINLKIEFWGVKLTTKIKVFMWQPVIDRLPSKLQLRKRRGPD